MRNLVKNNNVSENLMKAKSVLKKVRVGLILGTIISMLLMNSILTKMVTAEYYVNCFALSMTKESTNCSNLCSTI